MIGLLETNPVAQEEDDDPGHLWHCDPAIAQCGVTIAPEDQGPEDDYWDGVEEICSLCVLMNGQACPQCGEIL